MGITKNKFQYLPYDKGQLLTTCVKVCGRPHSTFRLIKAVAYGIFIARTNNIEYV